MERAPAAIRLSVFPELLRIRLASLCGVSEVPEPRFWCARLPNPPRTFLERGRGPRGLTAGERPGAAPGLSSFAPSRTPRSSRGASPRLSQRGQPAKRWNEGVLHIGRDSAPTKVQTRGRGASSLTWFPTKSSTSSARGMWGGGGSVRSRVRMLMRKFAAVTSFCGHCPSSPILANVRSLLRAGCRRGFRGERAVPVGARRCSGRGRNRVTRLGR